jgi:hypothetical protein
MKRFQSLLVIRHLKPYTETRYRRSDYQNEQ